jgi:hypothetical protein
MTFFFRLVDKRVIYRLGIILLAHAPVHVTDFSVECVYMLVHNFNMDWRILVFYPKPEARDNIY